MDHKQDGMIAIDGPFANEVGFTSEHFTRDSYLWRIGNTIYISLIECKKPRNGHFRGLLQALEKKGFTIKVPTPLRRMQEILDKNNFKPFIEEEGYEVWVKRPTGEMTHG